MQILLGSNSPRRSELLNSLGYDFTKVKIDCNEDFEGIKTNKVAAYLAEKKSLAYTRLNKDELLITADTVVICNNAILNKPADKAEAEVMLQLLSGTVHTVVTGVCIRSLDNKIVFDITTEVTMNSLSPSEMNYYIDNYEPMDKAGSYGIQEWIGLSKVAKLNGCFYNVMGLPTSMLYEVLTNKFNIFPAKIRK
jgi:septum formation protein